MYEIVEKEGMISDEALKRIGFKTDLTVDGEVVERLAGITQELRCEPPRRALKSFLLSLEVLQ
jgi:hypothetical protein